jgi:tRNA-specific 2-thiouridylase
MKQIVVAMSGGVDSSVAAALLHEQGHRVIGVTLRLLKIETGFGCCGSTRDIDDAKAVCAGLGIPHYVMDFADDFKENIIDPFIRAYVSGETPNPCISCNRFVKFRALLDKAVALGADVVATGHYARVREEGGNYRLRRALDLAKDQSYVLHHLGQAELSRILFPVGGLTKSEVRDSARRHSLKTAEKAESMEICFVPHADTAAYVKTHGGDAPTLQPGPIRDTQGNLLGTHKGVAFFTRGQREGLGLALGRPVYVVDLDPATNTVIVGSDQETLCHSFFVKDVHWTSGDRPLGASSDLSQILSVKIRSRHTAVPCRLDVRDDGVEVKLDVPQRAVTPGQSAVFYEGDEVVGGGVIGRAPVLA